MITKAMVREGYLKGVITIIDCPEGDEVVCKIGEYWFYFWNGDQGIMMPCEQFLQRHTAEEIIDAIWTELEVFRENWEAFCIEYLYYDYILHEAGIDGR